MAESQHAPKIFNHLSMQWMVEFGYLPFSVEVDMTDDDPFAEIDYLVGILPVYEHLDRSLNDTKVVFKPIERGDPIWYTSDGTESPHESADTMVPDGFLIDLDSLSYEEIKNLRVVDVPLDQVPSVCYEISDDEFFHHMTHHEMDVMWNMTWQKCGHQAQMTAAQLIERMKHPAFIDELSDAQKKQAEQRLDFDQVPVETFYVDNGVVSFESWKQGKDDSK